jgi:hypothetical protein
MLTVKQLLNQISILIWVQIKKGADKIKDAGK